MEGLFADGSIDLSELASIVTRSLWVSGSATVLAVLLGLPAGALLAWSRLPGLRAARIVTNAAMGLPPVVVGLALTLLLWRSGPVGGLELLYTQTAMILAQTVIAMPVVAGLAAAALGELDPELGLQLRGLGASRWQVVAALVREARRPLLAAVMMVGGNLRGQTRVLTTAIVLETRMGHLETAVLLGLVLLGLALLLSGVLTLLQGRR